MEQIFFFVFAAIALVAAVLLVAFRNPVYSALSLVAAFFALAGAFCFAECVFPCGGTDYRVRRRNHGTLPVRNHASEPGALPTPSSASRADIDASPLSCWRRPLVAQLGFMAGRRWVGTPASGEAPLFTDNINAIGKMLYTRYLFPFEVVSLILLVALIGVMVMVKGDREKRRKSIQAGALIRPGANTRPAFVFAVNS